MKFLPWAPCFFLVFQLYMRESHSQPYLPLVGGTDPNAFWLTAATIGNQTFNLIVDTGSADLWVYDTNVLYASGTDPVPHNTYTCIKRATSNCSYEGFFTVQYGGNANSTVSGNFTYDQVTIAGATVQDMEVEMVYEAGTLANWPPDGILGLSFGQNNAAVPKQATFMERLIPTLPEPVFGVEFYKTSSGDHLANLNFGYVNHTKARDGLFTAPVNKNTIWKTDDVSFTIGAMYGTPVPVSSNSTTPLTQNLMFGTSHPSIDMSQAELTSKWADTGGGSQFSVDPRITLAYYAQVDGAVPTDSTNTSYKFPCNATLPDVSLTFNNGESFGFRSAALTFNQPDADDMCTGPLSSVGVQEGAVGGVGAMFFESTYVVFNMSSEPSISFAAWNATAEVMDFDHEGKSKQVNA